MILNNLHVLNQEGARSIHMENGRISSVSRNCENNNLVKIQFENALAFPGLINSHDHLDFNSFHPLGNHLYKNYTEWGEDIHKNNKEEIEAVLKIPQKLRILWGIYKNLLNGVTTVVNHGDRLQVPTNLIQVLQDFSSLHSVGFEKNWKLKLNCPLLKNKQFVMHIGEGTGREAHLEIDTLIRWNILKRKIIGVHAVCMNEKQAAAFKALVWCPYTNLFLLGKTAAINLLKHHAKIIFGTDSTLTSSWNIWEHLRMARKTSMVSDIELIDMLTTTAADAWSLKKTGQLSPGFHADIVVIKQKSRFNNMDNFFASNPEDILLVIHQGNIKLFDEILLEQIPIIGVDLKSFNKIVIAGATKYVIGNLHALKEAIQTNYPEAAFPFH